MLRSRVWPAAAVVLVALALVLAGVGVDGPVAAAVALLIVAGVAVAVLSWALVRSRRQRRVHEDELTAWAAERAAQAERLRIARDLHDLASHGLGLITVRAAAARTVPSDTEHAAALADIERAGRAATTELRRMLTVLRGPGESAASLRPAQTLRDLPGIVAGVSAGGVKAVLDAAGVGDASAGVQLTVCAIVREALANTARHAGPVGARVVLRRERSDVVVTVEDDGPAPGWRPHPGAGQGLAGLRERVDGLGGELHVGRGERGFRVVARLPEGRCP